MTLTITSTEPVDDRPLGAALRRGWMRRCPNCGKGKLFSGYLKVNETCSACGEEFYHHRADDAPPYFTITVVAHVVVPGMIFTEGVLHLPVGLQLSIWLPVTLLLSLLLLPPIKGALIGLQWANYMHGFHPHLDDAEPDPTWAPPAE